LRNEIHRRSSRKASRFRQITKCLQRFNMHVPRILAQLI
jgi:hypothetical protein